ncbi:hypothetical protein [Tanticharoenia sakaeratensis]|uniref:hypothetical protein n=1 Tax=Tanticharoenia sakaeratensis TaxID=444053 RepID=UPI001F51AF05|nr:hypothetical protein [Tanticharoenia sakaeratensis]
MHRGVADGADLIKTETKVQIGHYLEGPEAGLPTAPLADRTINERIRMGYTPDDPGLRSGDMRESYGTRVSESALRVDASIGSDDLHAVYFELGRTIYTDKGVNYQPPRPELSVAAIRNEDRVVDGVSRAIVRALEGRPLPNRPVTDESENSDL